jgi:hypothetical protein
MTFLYFNVSYENNKDIDEKVAKFRHICGSIHRNLKNKTGKDTRIKFYETIAIPTLMYASETWVMRKKDKDKIQSAEIKFLRSTIGCKLLDRRKTEEIRKELQVTALNDKITENRRKWTEHLNTVPEESHGSTNQKEKETLGDRENAGNRNRLSENLILAVKKKKKKILMFMVF